MHKLILDLFITDKLLQHISAPQSKPSSGSSKSFVTLKEFELPDDGFDWWAETCWSNWSV